LDHEIRITPWKTNEKKYEAKLKKIQLKEGKNQSQPGPICQPHDLGHNIEIILYKRYKKTIKLNFPPTQC
jgi:hypothetical protein